MSRASPAGRVAAGHLNSPGRGPATALRHHKYELEVIATDRGAHLDFTANYLTGLFDPTTMAGLLDEVVAAATDLANDPDSHCIGPEGAA
jgi:hypothetical protein